MSARPTWQPLQPEATGAIMEETKWLKPSVSVSRIGDSASVQSMRSAIPKLFPRNRPTPLESPLA